MTAGTDVDLDYRADKLLEAAEKLAANLDTDIVFCRELIHPVWTLEEAELLLTDLVEAVRDFQRYDDGPDYRQHEAEQLRAEIDTALWPLLHGSPLETRCHRCVRGGRDVRYQGKAAVWNVCMRCADDGLNKLRAHIDAAVAR